MTISPFAAGSYTTTLNTQRLLANKDKLDGLTTQLGTGRVAETYGGLGAGRTTSLNANAQVARLDGYAANINRALNRITIGSTSLQNLSKVTSTTATNIATGLTNLSSPSSRNLTRATAANNLDLFVDTLNQNYGGTYLFGGRATESPPVASADSILNGDTSGDGLNTLIRQRKLADGAAGTPGTGNLSIPTTSTATVTISEAANVPGDQGKAAADRANFGFILGEVKSSNTAAIGSVPTPRIAPTATLSFGTQPKDGDVVRLAVNQPDGSQVFSDFTARTSAPLGANEFLITPTSGASLKTAVETLLGVGTISSAQSASVPGVTLTFADGSGDSTGNPASTALTVTASPNEGDTVTVTLGLRDGTTTKLTLTARISNETNDPSVFVIGATPEITAQNLQKALSDTVQTSAATTLSASSSVLAAKDFFAGTRSDAFAPRRVDTVKGGFSTNPAGKTVIWYKGDESLADPRGTATAQVSSGLSIGIGAQANEAGIRNALTGIATLASEAFASTKDLNDTTLTAADRTLALSERSRYTALTERVRSVLTPKQDDQGIAQVATDLSLASAQITNAKTQNSAIKAQLQNTLDGTDSISTEEVAAKLLAVQSQLQASYQVTSMLSKLSLVNYMS